MNMGSSECQEKAINIRIPREFGSRACLHELPIGLHHLAVGEASIAEEELENVLAVANNGGGVKKRICLSTKSFKYLEMAMRTMQTDSKNRVCVAALLWLSKLPEWLQKPTETDHS